jgi:hypothetical protein
MTRYGDWLEKQVAKSFGAGQDAQAAAASYLAELRQNWREAEKSQDRCFLGIIAGMAIFQLSIHGDISEASIAFVKLKSLEFLGPVLPVVVAYLFYQMCSIQTLTISMLTVHNTILESYFPERRECGIESALFPASFAAGHSSPLPVRPGRPGFARLIGPFVGGAVWLFVPPMFLVYSFIQLFRLYGGSSPLVWVSLTVASVLTLFGVLESTSGAGRW